MTTKVNIQALTMRHLSSYCLTVMNVTPTLTWTDSQTFAAAENSVLDAVEACVERYGWDKVTMDDICAVAGVSRATVYRMFPGGRDVLFDAVRVRGLSQFFTVLRDRVAGAATLEDLLVGCITVAHAELVADQHLATMLATAPGETLGDLTVSGVSRIVRVATEFVVPLAVQFLPREQAEEIVEVMCRLIISLYLAPSPTIDFSREDRVRRFVRTYLPAAVSVI